MRLRIYLRSDSAFGRGDGISGRIDSEVEHDARTGFPYIKGRTIKGLLVEACADLLFALEVGRNPALDVLQTSAKKLFGIPGSSGEDTGCLHIGSALLPEDLRRHALGRKKPYSAQQILEAMTAVRNQTAVDPTTDKPADRSLRATRVVIRNTIFYSSLQSSLPLNDTDYGLIAACASGVKRGGQNRTRGLGWLAVELVDVSGAPLDSFIKQIRGVV